MFLNNSLVFEDGETHSDEQLEQDTPETSPVTEPEVSDTDEEGDGSNVPEPSTDPVETPPMTEEENEALSVKIKVSSEVEEELAAEADIVESGAELRLLNSKFNAFMRNQSILENSLTVLQAYGGSTSLIQLINPIVDPINKKGALSLYLGKDLPTMESFSFEPKFDANTDVYMEGITDSIKAGFAKVRQHLDNLTHWFQSAWSGYERNIKAMLLKYNKLVTVLRDTKDNNPSEDVLNVDGRDDSLYAPEDILKCLTTSLKVADVLKQSIRDLCANVGKETTPDQGVNAMISLLKRAGVTISGDMKSTEAVFKQVKTAVIPAEHERLDSSQIRKFSSNGAFRVQVAEIIIKVFEKCSEFSEFRQEITNMRRELSKRETTVTQVSNTAGIGISWKTIYAPIVHLTNAIVEFALNGIFRNLVKVGKAFYAMCNYWTKSATTSS